MSRLLTLGWEQPDAEPKATSVFQKVSVASAVVALMASTITAEMQQSVVDGEPSRTEEKFAERLAAALPKKETMLGAYVGAPYTYPSSVTVKNGEETDFSIDEINWYTRPFKSPIYYGARVAQWFTGGKIGAMVDFIHSKALTPLKDEASFSGKLNGEPVTPRGKINDIIRRLEFSHGHNMLLFTGLFRLPSIGGRVSPYAGAGAGVLVPHTEFELQGGTRTYEYNFAGPAAQALFGLELRLSRMSVFLEYKFTYADYEAPLSEMDGSWFFLDMWRQVKRWIDNEPPPGGHVLTQLNSHQLVGGLAVRIAARPSATP